MNTIYFMTVTVHVLAAFLWLGGMFFFAVVGAPVLRRVEPATLRQDLFRRLGRSFRTVGWVCIAVLVVSGAFTLHLRGLRIETLASATFWGTTFGRTLAWKLITVLVMLSIQAFHDFVFGPRASALDGGPAQNLWIRRRVAWMARSNVVLGVGLVYLAVRLARGG